MKLKPRARTEEIVFQELVGETLVYDLRSNKAVCLNETAGIVWKLCNGDRSVSKMVDEMSRETNSSVTEDFVWFAVEELYKADLLAEGIVPDERFAGLSRRDLVRRVGIASVVALPIVSSITAPQAAAAQSTCMFDPTVCIPANSNVCPPGCTGMSVTYNLYSSTDGSCTGFIAMNSSACGPGGFSFNNDSEVIATF